MQRNRRLKIAGVKVGDRIRLIPMVDDPGPVPDGTLGTVSEIHHYSVWTQDSVSWDNGRKLMLASPPDKYDIIKGDT